MPLSSKIGDVKVAAQQSLGQGGVQQPVCVCDGVSVFQNNF